MLFNTYHLADIKDQAHFYLREDMSDRKAVDEVFIRKSYGRFHFTPAPGQHWLDLGANVGAFSVWAAKHGARVDAWEPEPECFRQLQVNVALNGLDELVTMHQAAAWPDDSYAESGRTLSVNGANGNVWRSSLLKNWRGGTDVVVPVESIEEHWTPDVCVKMDVEGSELNLLGGLGSKRVQMLVFEYSFDILPDMAQFKELMEMLRATYEHVHGGPGAARLAEERWIARGPANGVNVFCW